MLLSTAGKVLNRIILDRMREAVDKILRENQIVFRPTRSTADQITTLRIIVEQSLEWRTSRCINFIDYEKACGTSWPTIESLVKNMYQGTIQCSLVDQLIIKDLDFADDLKLLAHTQTQWHAKPLSLELSHLS